MIIGIDISTTQLDYAIINHDGTPTQTITRKIGGRPDAEGERAWLASDTTYNLLAPRTNLYAVAVERPMGRFAAKLAVIFGAVCAGIPAGIPVWDFTATVWRSTIGLNARASKAETIAFMQERWYPGMPLTEHEADAIGIGLAAHQHFERQLTTAKGSV